MAEAVEQTAAPIDADLVPDPVPSRTNSNATVGASATVRGPVRRPARSPRLTPTSLTAWTNQTSDRARMHVRGNRMWPRGTRKMEQGGS